jgi:carbon monoxide dehydrogenase subunit G
LELNDEKRIPAPREAVWKALNDPEVLRACIPGCEAVDKRSETEFSARVVVSVGPVKAKFTGEVNLTDIDPPNGYTISGKGSGGVAGFGKGSAIVKLRDDGAGTILAYTVNASVGGKLAQIGQRLIDSTAKKLADDFFAKFAAQVAPGAPVGAAATAPSPGPAPAAPTAPAAAAPPPGGAVVEKGWVKVVVVAAAGLATLWYLAHR